MKAKMTAKKVSDIEISFSFSFPYFLSLFISRQKLVFLGLCEGVVENSGAPKKKKLLVFLPHFFSRTKNKRYDLRLETIPPLGIP